MAHQVDQPSRPASWQRPMVVWPLAWFVMGVGLTISDVHSEPRQESLWVALVLGTLGWGAAGGCSAPGDPTAWRKPLGIAWALLFPASLLVGLGWMEYVEYALRGAGFEGVVVALGLGGAVGGLLTAISTPGGARAATRWVRGLGAFALFGALFLVGSCAGTLGSYLLADLVEAMLGGLLGDTTALTLGFGLGWAIGGLAAGAAVASTQADSIAVWPDP